MHRLLRFTAVTAALLAGAACSHRAGVIDAVIYDESAAGTLLPVTRLRAEPYSLTYNSGLTDSARVVVTDARQWAQVWSAIWRNHSPEPARPEVDFTNEQLVVAALGERNSGGYGIIVESAAQHPDYVEVVVRTVSPGVRCGTTAALTQPVDVARIPAGTLPVRFRDRGSVNECP
ncbi:MAG TPA: protease complex subunit PrcB family protein [Longimicrobium sp.]|nr:protease complex subunit PrcB family protein [Longimicrobium sp.]